MELEGGQVIEIAVSVGAVGGFVAALVTIGLLFDRTDLDPMGGIVMVGAIAMFVIVMAAIGVVLADKEA